MLSKEKYLEQMNTCLNNWGLSEHTREGLSAVYDTWLERKAWLREHLAKHPNWDSDKQAVVTQNTFYREGDFDVYNQKMEEFYSRWVNLVDNENMYYDGSGSMDNHMYKYLFVPMQNIRSTQLTASDVDSLVRKMSRLQEIKTLDENKRIAVELMKVLKPGMKLSRLLNKFLTLWNAPELCGRITNSAGNAVSWYDKWFAEISDALSPKTMTCVVYLSIHPCDYFNMSMGTGWRSCHNMSSGGYRGGCVSYLLDEVSMVSSVVVLPGTTMPETLWDLDKVNRQMYMWRDTTVLASRLYPNNNDTSKKQTIVDSMLDIIKVCIPMGAVKVLKCGETLYDSFYETFPQSMHYPDYRYRDYQTKIYVNPSKAVSKLIIGAKPISLSVGIEFTPKNHADLYGSFRRCAGCGKLICTDSHNEYESINGEYYCNDCYEYCGVCGCVHLKTNMHPTYKRDGHSVCLGCAAMHTKVCVVCGESDFTDNLSVIRNATGKKTGKYIHRDCNTGKYGFCRCNSAQELSLMGKYTTLVDGAEREYRTCSQCNDVLMTWFTRGGF